MSALLDCYPGLSYDVMCSDLINLCPSIQDNAMIDDMLDLYDYCICQLAFDIYVMLCDGGWVEAVLLCVEG